MTTISAAQMLLGQIPQAHDGAIDKICIPESNNRRSECIPGFFVTTATQRSTGPTDTGSIGAN